MASREFPLDIFFEILVLLPAKSLLRFKCVSKSWLSLISSPSFTKTHLQKHSSNTNDTRLFFSSRCDNFKFTHCLLNSALCGTNAEATELEIPAELRTQSPIEIVGSCNGLLCIAIQRRRVAIWNPSIGKYRMLPLDRDLASLRKTHRYDVAYGFGYDHLSDDYKVVEFYYQWIGDCSPATYPLTVMVYSRKRNYWRRIEEDLNGVFSVDGVHDGIFLNGNIHWTMQDLQRETGKILTFDLANEKYGEIQVPEILRSSKINGWNLGVLGDGCLCLDCSDHFYVLDVWIMKGYGASQSWNKVASILIEDPLTILLAKSVFMSKGDEILLDCGRGLVWYDPERDSTREPDISGDMRNVLKVDIYKESLVWPEGEA